MRRVIGFICLLVFVSIMAACGGGGGGGGGGDVTVFTTQMLDSMPNIYLQYPSEVGDPGSPGTVREEITITGSSGTYQAKVVQSFFDGSGNFMLQPRLAFIPSS